MITCVFVYRDLLCLCVGSLDHFYLPSVYQSGLLDPHSKGLRFDNTEPAHKDSNKELWRHARREIFSEFVQ